MRRVVLLFALSLPALANAQSWQFHGYLDVRAVSPSDARSFTDGGYGKTRFGDGDSSLQFATAMLGTTWQVTPATVFVADAQVSGSDPAGGELLDAYLRWRPVSLTPWRHAVKVGLFFPPVSLENDAIGWTSPWTLTPSAINSWVGEELRAVGVEWRGEHRGEQQTFEFTASVFGGNDPAGDVMASRGWSLSDRTYGLGSETREPDAFARTVSAASTTRSGLVREIDGRLGGYVSATWRPNPAARFTIMRYDNNGDPSADVDARDQRQLYAWDTRFWSAGGEWQLGDTTFVAQAMDGHTVVDPRPNPRIDTAYTSAFVLAARDYGPWRPAFRFDWFRSEDDTTAADPTNEWGHALTAALNWRPKPRLRLIGEIVHIDSSRSDRATAGLPVHERETQVQFAARWIF